MKRAVIEAETREEVMKEMEERMRSMERMYARRLMSEVCFSNLSMVTKRPIFSRRRWSRMT